MKNTLSYSHPSKRTLTFIWNRHLGPVWQISWAHPRFGNILATCGYDQKIIIWKEKKANEWEIIKEFNHHKESGKDKV